MKTTKNSSNDFFEEIKRLFSGMLLGSLLLLFSNSPLSGQCSITLTSAQGSDNQNSCINTAINDITYSTSGATGADVTGLPAGVTGNWIENVVTITGTPTEDGTFGYTITLWGDCSGLTASGTIKVSSSAPGAAGTITGTSTVCQGATGVEFTVPEITDAISYLWAYTGTGATINGTNNNVTIDFDVTATSGDLTVSGVNGCGNGTISQAYSITVSELLPVSVTIAASSNPVCSGTEVTYTAIPVNEGTTPVYQWKVNGADAGTNSTTYSYTPVNGDVVTCILTSSELCTTGSPAASNEVTMTVNPLPIVTLTCSDTDTTFYAGASITFTAGVGTQYDFLVDGTSVQNGTDDTWSSTTLTDGQIISVIVTTADGCSAASSGIKVNVIPLPSGWNINPSDFTYNGQITAKVLVNGTAVQSGFLGAFVGEECRGIAEATYYLPDNYYFGITCYSDVESGETLIFKYYDNVADSVYKTDKTIPFVSGMNIGTPAAPFIIKNCSDFSVSFPAGWSWFSVNTLHDDMSLNSILSSGLTDDDYIKDQNLFAFYYNTTGWVGSLEEIDPARLYKIKLKNAGGIDFCGTPVDVNAIPVSLIKGWNWIGYTPTFVLTVNEALAGFPAVSKDYIKNQFSFSEYVDGYGWFGGLINMSPSEGYMLKVANAGTFNYPDSPSKNEPLLKGESGEQSFIPNKYEFNGSVTARVFIDGLPAGSENDILYAYVDNEIRGIARGLYFSHSDTYIYPLMIHSNLSEGETIQFKYFEARKNRLYTCAGNISFKSDMVIANPLKSFELHTISNLNKGKDDTDSELELTTYPNPFDKVLNIEFKIPESAHVRLTVCDLAGNDIAILLDQDLKPDHFRINWSPQSGSGGIYIIRIQAGSRYCFRKVIFMP